MQIKLTLLTDYLTNLAKSKALKLSNKFTIICNFGCRNFRQISYINSKPIPV